MRLEKAKSISPRLVLMHLSECYWIFLNIVTSYLILYAQVHGSHCRPVGRRSPPIVGTGGGNYYQHNPQDPAGSPRWLDHSRG